MSGQGKQNQHMEKVYMEKRKKHQAPGHPRTFTPKRLTNKEADRRCDFLLFSLIILSEPIFH